MANKSNPAFSVVVDDGTREIPIKNTFGKTICKVHFRPGDFSILDRLNGFISGFDKLVEPLQTIALNNDGTASLDSDWATLKKVESELTAKINELFDMDDAEAIFTTRNAFSSVGGQFFCWRVINALAETVRKAIDEEAELSKQRMAKYTEDLDAPATAPLHEVTSNDRGVTDKA